MSENLTARYIQLFGIIGTGVATAVVTTFGANIYSMFALGWCGAAMLTAYVIENNE